MTATTDTRFYSVIGSGSYFDNLFKCYFNSRKRSREEDSNDFMPLSKRINNLHLNNNFSQNYDTGYINSNQIHYNLQNNNNIDNDANAVNNNNLGYFNSIHETQLNLVRPNIQSSSASSHQHQHQHHHHHQHQQHQQQIVDQQTQVALVLNTYNPELSEKDNPHYFDKNKMLYDLYVERIRRCPNSN